MQKERWRSIYCSELHQKMPGDLVTIAGWIEEKRNLGSLLFLIVRDVSGKIQVIIDQEEKELYDNLSKLTRESTISLQAVVSIKNDNSAILSTSENQKKTYELLGKKLLFSSISAPFPLNLKAAINEETDLRYRYLIMRKPEVLKKYQARSRISSFFRRALESKHFTEIETPILSKPTPEGARDYLVPSRIYPGKFFALPQSPQLFKQLCMIGGLDRYYQIARCFRDEDLRADRQPEFTQVDIEASFLTTYELRQIVEKMICELWKTELNEELPPLKELTYAQAIHSYGSDKPDLRFDFSIIDMGKTFEHSENTILKKSYENRHKERTALLRIPNISRWSRNQWDLMIKSIRNQAQDSGIFLLDCVQLVKTKELSLLERSPQKFSEQEKKEILSLSGALAGDAIIIMSGISKKISLALGDLRSQIVKKVPEIIHSKTAAVWIIDFPMFEKDEHGQLQALHHPFTTAKESLENLPEDPSEWIAEAYDLVINGYEIGGGSRRIVDSNFQKKVFDLLNISEKEQKFRFGFFLNALSFGAPIHCGIALGLDRIVMLLTRSQQLRDVIVFPKTSTANCLMTDSPTTALKESLESLKIAIT